MDSLVGRTALVVGAGSGIGASVARELAGCGARVLCADVDFERAEATAKAFEEMYALRLDARDEGNWESVIEAITDRWGGFEVLVHTVGLSAASLITETSLAEWRRVLDTNLDAAFLATKYGMRTMRESGGALVHLGSATGSMASSGAAAYATSKGALNMLVRCAAKECRSAQWPIRVNLVSPAGVKTPMWKTMPFFRELIDKEGSEEAAFESLSKSGGGVFCDPDEVAKVVVFLCSDQARHITGVNLAVDDGYSLG